MKILVIAATPFFADRGCHLRIYNEALGLQKLGHQVRLCTYHNGQNISDLDIHRIKPAAWYQKTSPGFAWGKIWLDWKLLFLTKKQIRKFSPDVVYCHLYEGLAIGFFSQLFRQSKVPLLADLQGDLASELENYNSQNFLIKKILPFFSEFFLKKANWIFISSNRGQEIFEQNYPLLKNYSVLPDGIDPETFSQKTNADPSAEKEISVIKKWKGKTRLLVYAGGLSSAKGLQDFFIFFGQNFSSKDNWKFLIFGSGPEKDFYQKTIKKNRWEDQIFLAEQHNFFQLPFYLKLADLAIDPKNNTSESSGKLPVYMAAGLPILCFDNSFNRQQLGQQGFYFQNWKDAKKIMAGPLPIKPIIYAKTYQQEVKKMEKILKKLAG